ncbi:MAG: prepilin-type N-terminal cleavage/methylation domain-containing protein [Candidatus Omnitrophica bacterium]|nr:prepilin-type N-terminal cleavage/methylation domain-containing protein [Candidatus Omnitrophota bacterium]
MKKTAFTLIELIVVIAIIGVLAAIIAPNAFKAVEKSKVSKAITDFKAIKSAANALYADTGSWPHGGDSAVRVINSDIMRNVSSFSGWDGPYLDKFTGATPWRGTYYFTTNPQMGRGAQYELAVEFEDSCFNTGPNGGCPIPRVSAQGIDSNVDDGNLATGEFQGGSDYHWVLQWDFCATYACW